MRLSRWLAPLAAAAAVLVIGLPAAIYLLTSQPAAHAELVAIHRHNLSPHREFFTDADPAKLAEYLKGHLGFSPAMPHGRAGMAIRGCCIAHFRDKPAGSYVVDTPRGVISVIIVADTPKALGMKKKLSRGGRTYWAESYAKCEMMAVRIGSNTYCAVGEVPQDLLTDLLVQLVP